MKGPTLIRRLLLGVMLGVVVYAGFVLFRGYGIIKHQLSTFDWSMYALALSMTFGNYCLRFLKWEFYLAKLDISGVPKLDSFLTFLSGFVLTVTPGKVGEVFKSLVLFETYGVPGARTAPIVVAERLTDLIGIIVLVIIGSLGFSGGLIWAVAGAVAVAIVLFVVASRAIPDALVRWMEGRDGFFGKLAPKVKTAWESLRTLVAPSALFLPTALSCISWALEGLSLYVILLGFHTTPSATLSLFTYSTSQLAGALIPVPGGLGITEGSLEQQLVRLGGIEQAAATSAMILVRVATLWFAVLLGFVSLAVLRRRHPKLLSGD